MFYIDVCFRGEAGFCIGAGSRCRTALEHSWEQESFSGLAGRVPSGFFAMGCLWSTNQVYYPLPFSFLDIKGVEIASVPLRQDGELFRYTVNSGGITFYIHQRCIVQRVQPAHDQPVIVPTGQDHYREPYRVRPVRRPGSKNSLRYRYAGVWRQGLNRSARSSQ